MSSVISIENLSKSYRLGVIGSGTLREDLQSWWHRVRGLPDPNRRVDQAHLPVEGHTLWALQNISLEIGQGEVWGIIGRNGAGKSTLLKILSRVTAPTSGRVRIKGRVASLLEVGTGFHPELTGRENIYLNGAILGMTRAEVSRKFDEIVAFSEIDQFIDTPVKRYSSGMYVRLAFAVAAHLDPEILVVDEVLAVGDAEFQKKCLGKMNDVAKQGRTVLFVSHNMGSVRALCSSAMVLKSGRMHSFGAAADQIAGYLGGLESDAGKDACKREDRIGDGSIVFEGIEVVDLQTGSRNNVCAGNAVEFVFQYCIPSGQAGRQAAFGFSCFHGVSGEKIFHADSMQQNRFFQGLEKNGCIRCRIDKFPLPCGRYHIDAIIYTAPDSRRAADYIQSCMVFDVIDGDFYHTGKKGEMWGGMVFVDCKWMTEAGR
ncbi:MAG: ABC transporter ATP-binding protein [Kiritimatiellia bacterium]